MVTVSSVKEIAVPKGTPRSVITYLNKRFRRLCEDKDFIKGSIDLGANVMYQGPMELEKFRKDGYEQYGRMIKEFNIKFE